MPPARRIGPLLALLVLAACDRTPAHLRVEDDLAGARFALLDQDSAAVVFPEAVRGRPALVTAVFTHCPDVCPMTMANVRRVRRALGADTARVGFVTVSFDPARDTPSVLKAYGEAWNIDRDWRLLTGAPATVDALMDRLGVRREPGPRDTLASGAVSYTISHSDKLLLLDAEGRVVETYGGSAAPPEQVAGDVRALF